MGFLAGPPLRLLLLELAARVTPELPPPLLVVLLLLLLRLRLGPLLLKWISEEVLLASYYLCYKLRSTEEVLRSTTCTDA